MVVFSESRSLIANILILCLEDFPESGKNHFGHLCFQRILFGGYLKDLMTMDGGLSFGGKCEKFYPSKGPLPMTDPWEEGIFSNYIYPHEWLIFMANDGKCSKIYPSHGSYGLLNLPHLGTWYRLEFW